MRILSTGLVMDTPQAAKDFGESITKIGPFDLVLCNARLNQERHDAAGSAEIPSSKIYIKIADALPSIRGIRALGYSFDENHIRILSSHGEPVACVSDGQEITVTPQGVRNSAVLTGAFNAALLQRGYVLLHGSGAMWGDKATIWFGDSGAGKSTAASIAVARGAVLLSDDIVPLRIVNGCLVTFQRERELALDPHPIDELVWVYQKLLKIEGELASVDECKDREREDGKLLFRTALMRGEYEVSTINHLSQKSGSEVDGPLRQASLFSWLGRAFVGLEFTRSRFPCNHVEIFQRLLNAARNCEREHFDPNSKSDKRAVKPVQICAKKPWV